MLFANCGSLVIILPMLVSPPPLAAHSFVANSIVLRR